MAEIYTLAERRKIDSRLPVGEGYLRPRERQILDLYMAGVRRRDIPRLIGCTDSTVCTHIRAARERTGAKTIHELIGMLATALANRQPALLRAATVKA